LKEPVAGPKGGEKEGGWVNAEMLKTEMLKDRMDSDPRYFGGFGQGAGVYSRVHGKIPQARK